MKETEVSCLNGITAVIAAAGQGIVRGKTP
jgi:hypothetical protein